MSGNDRYIPTPKRDRELKFEGGVIWERYHDEDAWTLVLYPRCYECGGEGTQIERFAAGPQVYCRGCVRAVGGG